MKKHIEDMAYFTLSLVLLTAMFYYTLFGWIL